MLNVILCVLTRILSNSYIGVFQKLLFYKGERPSVINFYSYLGLSFLGICFVSGFNTTPELLTSIIIMGILGASGNYFIIKALSCGELSALAPINSYKPVIALILGIILLKEVPQIQELLGIFLIIIGTVYLNKNAKICNKAGLYRFVALVLSGCEAVFIKKVILLTDINTAFFFWALSGFVFSSVTVFKYKLSLSKANILYQIILIILIALMQYSTNFVFSKIPVASALALFQLSTLFSVFLGAKIFKETKLIEKSISSIIMIAGAILVIL